MLPAARRSLLLPELVRFNSMKIKPDNAAELVTVSVSIGPAGSPGETGVLPPAERLPPMVPPPRRVWLPASVSVLLEAWLRSSVPPARSNSALGDGSELPMRRSVPRPPLVMLVGEPLIVLLLNTSVELLIAEKFTAPAAVMSP